MWTWRQKIWFDKKPLVGLVVRVEDNPWQSKREVSTNEKKFYYIKWDARRSKAAKEIRIMQNRWLFSQE